MGYRQPVGFDRTRGYVIGRTNIVLEHLEEAYTSENWLVRIYRVLKQKNRPTIPTKNRKKQSSRTYSKKVWIFTCFQFEFEVILPVSYLICHW